MKKIDSTTLLKITGWIAIAVGGLLANVASDLETRKEVDSKIQNYISESKENGEDD